MLSRCSGRKWRRVRVEIDPLAAGDLDQTLAGKIRMIIDLSVRRRYQNARLMLRRLKSGNPLCDLLEHGIQHGLVGGIDAGGVAQIEPEPALCDGVDHLATA
jgi:hypothetical protein